MRLKALLNLCFLPYLKPLLPLHEQAGQQPDNLCGPYWVALLLQTYAGLSVSPVEVAIAAATLLPSQGDPTDWLPPGATSHLGPDYDKIPTIPDASVAGTAIAGLVQAISTLSQGKFALLPLQAKDWGLALQAVWHLCQTYPDWPIAPLLNLHAGCLWGSCVSPLQAMTYLEGSDIVPPPPDWAVGHFALLAGQVQAEARFLYALLDTYPHFGWGGLHLQPSAAIAQSLHRPQQETDGGLALFVPEAARSRLVPHLIQAGLQIAPWDNGSPFCPE